MASPINETFAQLVESALPLDGGIAPREAFQRIGGDRSSPNGVRGVLLHLVRTGRAVREGEMGKFSYRRASPGAGS